MSQRTASVPLGKCHIKRSGIGTMSIYTIFTEMKY